jgi:molybdopterin synthase sulfur carrier subunit
MTVRVLYFASLKEAIGTGAEQLELPGGVSTVGQLRDWLAGQGRAVLATATRLRSSRRSPAVKGKFDVHPMVPGAHDLGPQEGWRDAGRG